MEYIQHKITIFMVIRNVATRKRLFMNVVKQASKVTKHFYFVNHGSTDNTIQIIESIAQQYSLSHTRIDEKFTGTMDEIKGKHYQILKKSLAWTWHIKEFIFILDWDEILSDTLIEEIKHEDMKQNVYLINRQTFLIHKIIDKRSFLPLLFEVNGVEIKPLQKFHKLYQIKSQKIKKLKGKMRHYSYTNMNDMVKKNLYYAQWEAESLFEKNQKIWNYKIFFLFIKEGFLYFTYTLFYHDNWTHLEGWIFSFQWIIYKFYKYLFYYEMKCKKQES